MHDFPPAVVAVSSTLALQIQILEMELSQKMSQHFPLQGENGTHEEHEIDS